MYLKLEIRGVCMEFLALKYVFIVFFRNNSDDDLIFIFVHQKS